MDCYLLDLAFYMLDIGQHAIIGHVIHQMMLQCFVSFLDVLHPMKYGLHFTGNDHSLDIPHVDKLLLEFLDQV